MRRSSADRVVSDNSQLRANWRAVHAFNRAKSNEINKKMKTLIGSINRSPLRCGFFTLAIALCCFALSPPVKAQDCPSVCTATGLNTGVGTNALSSVNPAVGIDVTAELPSAADEAAFNRDFAEFAVDLNATR